MCFPLQFENYARQTFHIGPSAHSLRFVTDGQLPLRQCLHPETCSKNLDLPSYYAYFHDLRKEFRAFYNMPEEPQSIRDMVACILCNIMVGQLLIISNIIHYLSICRAEIRVSVISCQKRECCENSYVNWVK